jgi:hypothetical protein
MANNPNLPISTGNLNEYHQSVIGDLSDTNVNGSTVADQISTLGRYHTKTLTAKFNLSDSNPATWGSYEDDATGMTAGSSDFDDFFGYYPCILENGAELGRLDPTDITKYADGTSAPITTVGKDVMICFPRRDLKIWSANGYGYISFTSGLGKTGYGHYAHKYKGNDCKAFYLGRYSGYVENSLAYSVSGKTPTTNLTWTGARPCCQNRGTNYEMLGFYQMTYYLAMYMLKYLGQNQTTAFGLGLVNASAVHATGGTDALGLNYAESTGNVQCSMFGIEDMIGNSYKLVDGAAYTTANKLMASLDLIFVFQ